MKFFNTLYLHDTTNGDYIVTVELPGVDPKEVKVTHSPNEGRLYLNESVIGVANSKYYDFNQAKAEIKHGLLKVTVPQKAPVRAEIPLTVG